MLQQILDSFSKDYEKNDQLVVNFVNRTYDSNTSVFDVDFVANQICKALLDY